MSELSELFERDPGLYSEQDIDKIVAKMREARAQFELGVKTTVGEKPAKAAKSQKTLDLLKDLGLG